MPPVLYDSDVVPRQEITAWRPPVDGVGEVCHARFVEHAHPGRQAHLTRHFRRMLGPGRHARAG
jgi:hypothetical protein